MIARGPVPAGFTLVEMLTATAMTMAVMGAILTLVDSAHRTFQLQGEGPDMQQRLRAAIELLAADARTADGSGAPVRPYRVGGVRDDAEAGVYYRPDTISVFYVPEPPTPGSAAVVASRTYYLEPDPGSNSFDLMQYDGRQTALPVVDHVASLAFEYFGDDRARIDPALLTDGPWRDDVPGRHPFDADLLRLRSVGMTLRVRSALGPRLVPDIQIAFRVALRNMPPGTE